MILVLRAGDPVDAVRERRGPFSRWIRESIGEVWSGGWAEHDIRTDEPFPTLRSVACIIITGSSANVPDRLPWMLRTEAFLRDAGGEGTPMLGLCFGHQILAQAFGGNVIRNPLGREIGTVQVDLLDNATKEEPWLAALGASATSFAANFSHIDTVESLPSNARRFATTPKEANAVFAIGANIRGVQFHPEFDADVMRGYVQARADLIDAEGQDSRAIHQAVRETPASRALLPAFLRTFVKSTFVRR